MNKKQSPMSRNEAKILASLWRIFADIEQSMEVVTYINMLERYGNGGISEGTLSDFIRHNWTTMSSSSNRCSDYDPAWHFKPSGFSMAYIWLCDLLASSYYSESRSGYLSQIKCDYPGFSSLSDYHQLVRHAISTDTIDKLPILRQWDVWNERFKLSQGGETMSAEDRLAKSGWHGIRDRCAEVRGSMGYDIPVILNNELPSDQESRIRLSREEVIQLHRMVLMKELVERNPELCYSNGGPAVVLASTSQLLIGYVDAVIRDVIESHPPLILLQPNGVGQAIQLNIRLVRSYLEEDKYYLERPQVVPKETYGRHPMNSPFGPFHPNNSPQPWTATNWARQGAREPNEDSWNYGSNANRGVWPYPNRGLQDPEGAPHNHFTSTQRSAVYGGYAQSHSIHPQVHDRDQPAWLRKSSLFDQGFEGPIITRNPYSIHGKHSAFEPCQEGRWPYNDSGLPVLIYNEGGRLQSGQTLMVSRETIIETYHPCIFNFVKSMGGTPADFTALIESRDVNPHSRFSEYIHQIIQQFPQVFVHQGGGPIPIALPVGKVSVVVALNKVTYFVNMQ